ncbi:MAG: DUF1730 domain-containing protein, partial [Myxococcales bacterium]|nr:DUF1730 domain-containing protein [Myxococcales bacterium]
MGAMAADRVSFSDQVRAEALRLGFDRVGVARANVPLELDHARYRAFLDAGMHGEMAWLAEHGPVRERLDGAGILDGARSVVCVARRYGREPQPPAASSAGEPGPGITGSIARYARGRDYHGFLRHRLRRLAAFVRRLGTPTSPVRARPLCDKEPVLERAWAVRAGLGFVGKNGMLIVPGLGSMVLLGEVVTTLDLVADDETRAGVRGGGPPPREGGEAPAERRAALPTERCGACTRCLDACPTQAFPSAFVLDARRCISYLTIEHRGEIALELREAMGAHLFGCDDCQAVCPFNGGSGARAPLWAADGDPFAPLERWSRLRLESLLRLDEPAWARLSAGTPLRRAGRA